MTTFFAQRNTRFAEDLADETINRVTLKIGETVIENKFAYIYGVAKFVFLESVRKEKNHLNIDDLNIAAKSPKADENEFSDKCLDKCLAELAGDERSLILDYFSEEKQAKIDLHKKISESLKLTKTALRMKIVRIKRKLKNCLQECAT